MKLEQRYITCRIPYSCLFQNNNSKRFNQSILKEISSGCSLEGLMLKLKLQYFGHLMRLTGKDPNAGKDWGQEEMGATKDEMAGWHHQLDGHEFG